MSAHNNSQVVFRVGPLINLPATLHKLGYQPEPILQKAGFELDQFVNPDTELPYVKSSMLLASCVEATGCDHLGFLLGVQADPAILGIPGFMLKVAPDVKTALNCLSQNLDLHDQGGVVTLDTANDSSMFGFKIILPDVQASEQIYDLSMVIANSIMRTICGSNWKPKKVLISRPRPQRAADYERHFHAPVEFSADQSAVVFSTYWLNQKSPNSDPLLFNHLEKQAAEFHQHMAVNLIDKLHQFIGRSLADQTCSIQTAALSLNIHHRTLERRLHDFGTTFSQERDKFRYYLAQEFLSSSKMTNKQIALMLGYSDATVFNRSFKRWSGTTPVRWRTQHSYRRLHK